MEKTKVVVCIEKMVEVEVDTNLCNSDGNPEFIAEIEKLVNTPSLFNTPKDKKGEIKEFIFAAYRKEDDMPLYED